MISALVHPLLTARRRFRRWQLARSRAKVIELTVEIELIRAMRMITAEMAESGDSEGIDLLLEMLG